MKLNEEQARLVDGGTEMKADQKSVGGIEESPEIASTEMEKHFCPTCNKMTAHIITVSGYVCKNCGALNKFACIQ